MAFPFDQELRLDSLWSSGDLHFENSLEEHGVSGQLVLDKIALEISVWQRCRPLQLALTAHQLLRKREGVRVLGDIAPSQEASFLSLQLLDMSHWRWSSFSASAALEPSWRSTDYAGRRRCRIYVLVTVDAPAVLNV